MLEEDNSLLTPEENLGILSDTIIASIIKDDEQSRQNRVELFSKLSPEVFRDENYAICKVLYNFMEEKITPTVDFYRMYLLRNEKLLRDAGDKLDINTFSDLDEDPAVGYVLGVLKKLVRLQQEETLSTEDFKIKLELYKIEFRAIETANIYNQAKVILNEGLQIGRVRKQGYEDSTTYVKERLASMDGLLDRSSGEGFLDASKVGMRDNSRSKPEKIGEFGIDVLDKHYGGIYTKLFYSVIAPTKGGKSKFCTALAHNCLMNGVSGVVWAVEGGYESWLAQLRAKHFHYLYNKDVTDVTQLTFGVTQQVILSNSFKTDALRELEEQSRLDLFTNPSYGNLYCIDKPFEADTCLEYLTTAIKLNGAKFVVIDYIQLVGGNNTKKNERIGETYQKLLKWCNANNVALISPAQFTQEFMKALSTSKDLDSIETRVSGGESSEVIRTPDINIALYATPEDIQHKQMKLLSIPSRYAEPFPATDIYADLSVCDFSSLESDE